MGKLKYVELNEECRAEESRKMRMIETGHVQVTSVELGSEVERAVADEIFFSGFMTQLDLKERSISELRELFKSTWIGKYADPHARFYLVRLDGITVASFCLFLSERRPTQSSRSPGLLTLCRRYGVAAVVQMQIFSSLFNYKSSEDEAYIAHLAVAPNWQGKGIGRIVLQWIAEHSRNELGKRRLTLYVDSMNQVALSLYQNAGFSIEGSSHSWLTRWALNTPRWHFLCMPLQNGVTRI